MRRGDDPKLAPEEEQALLEKLRRQREEKSYALLQAEAQGISAKMANMDLTELPAMAKDISKKEKAMACSPLDGHVALVLNVLLRSCSPPVVKESPTKGKGGGKKQANSIKVAAAKVVEGPPPTSAEVRKTLKANMALLKEATGKESAGQLALLKALQSWLVSSQGANACAHSAKIVEVLYDADATEEETCMRFWTDTQAQLVREAAELTEASAALATLTAEKAAADEAVRLADREKSDAAWYEKQAEHTAQATRCGGNPSKEDEAAEKAALANLKKCKEYHTQTSKVLVARAKNLTEVSAEFETSQRLVEQFKQRGEGGAALFTKHAAPFFEWLAEEDDDDDDDDVEVN